MFIMYVFFNFFILHTDIKNCCLFLILMSLLYVQREQVLFLKVTMLHHPGQTLDLERDTFLVFAAATSLEGEMRGVHLVAICNHTARYYLRRHTTEGSVKF